MSIKATQQYVKRGLISESDYSFLSELDPSKTKKYMPFILKSYFAGINLDLIQSRIMEFDTLLQRNQCDKRDINSFKKFQQFDEYVQKLNGIKSAGEIKREIKKEADIILDTDDIFCVRPLSHNSCCLYGAGSKWCISGRNSAHWERYVYDQLITFYIVQVRSSDIKKDLKQDLWKVAVAVYPCGRLEVYDAADHNVGRMHGLVFLDNFLKSLCVERSLFKPIDMDDRIGDLLSYKQLKGVTTLDLSRKGITKLPNSIGDMKQLQSLILSENKIEALPENIGMLSELKTLYLFHNQIITLPESIGNLTGLRWLGLSGNRLSNRTKRELKRKLPFTRIYFEEMK